MHQEEISITEDLMREHGMLNRLLLIYEEVVRRIEAGEEFPLDALDGAVTIIKLFIEDYHEKIEEEYLFPLFEKKKVRVKLVQTLRAQHIKGREVTAEIQNVLSDDPYEQKSKNLIKKLLKKFIRMYRPHEAREDTILFPLVRSLIKEEEFQRISNISDEMEHRLFGERGFETILEKVAAIEKELNIFELNKFTPNIEGQEK